MKDKNYSRFIKVLIFVIDFWLINLAFFATRELGLDDAMSNVQFTSFFLVFALIWIIAGFFYKLYHIDTTSVMRSISLILFSAFPFHILIVTAILTAFRVYNFSLPFMACVYTFSAVFIVGFRVVYKLIRKYFEFSSLDQRNVIIIGATGSGKALYQFFTSDQTEGYHVKGLFDDDVRGGFEFKDLIVRSLETVKIFCLCEGIDEIYFALPPTHHKLLEDLSRFADDNFIYFRIAPDFSKTVHDHYNIFLINSIPILTTRREPLCIALNAYMKRLFDIVFSLTVVLTVFPVIFPIIALAIRLDSEGPVFFKQLRPGKKNKVFDCYKFRTMKVNNNTELQASRNDSRVTRVGRFLRKTNLDELPQFFNVLLGNMSVVGPRPNMIGQLEEYSKRIQGYKVRHFVTPGITGFAQINGFRGETRELELMEKRVQYDVQYIENWSLSLDIKIICLTLWNMARGEKNAY